MFRDFRGKRPIEERIRNLNRNLKREAAKKKFTDDQGGINNPNVNVSDPQKKSQKNQ